MMPKKRHAGNELHETLIYYLLMMLKLEAAFEAGALL